MINSWLRSNPIVTASAVVVAAIALVGATMFVMQQRLEGRAAELYVEGSIGQEVLELDNTVGDVQAFVSAERLRLAMEGSTEIPVRLLDDTEVAVNRVRDLAARATFYANAPPELGTWGEEIRLAFLSYLGNGDRAELDRLDSLAAQLESAAHVLGGEVGVAPADAHAAFLTDVAQVRWMRAAAVATILPLVLGLIWWAGRRDRRALEVLKEREQSLAAANHSISRRNEQLHGLYLVVAEVTETLSMKYIVQTTVREALHLVGADLVALHVVDGDRLVLAGTDRIAELQDVALADDVEIAHGLVSRAAKRGRTMHFDETRLVIRQDPQLAGARSGIVVPLIVGTRVVGVVSCWSRRENAFTVDDELVLELMAGQVATAVAAADVYEESDRHAHIDALTELPNRRQLAQDIKFEFERAVQRGAAMCVAMIDVDDFKGFNDRFGHHGGDVALQRVAATLARGVRTADRLYRYGGEEFVIVFDSFTPHQVKDACERLRESVAALSPLDDNPEATTTISIGLAFAPDHADSFEQLVEQADKALYEAKGNGRNRVLIYTPDNEGAEVAA